MDLYATPNIIKGVVTSNINQILHPGTAGTEVVEVSIENRIIMVSESETGIAVCLRQR